MKDVGRSFGVSYDHDGSSGWAASDHISKREDYSLDDIYTIDYNSDVPARMPLFPPNGTIDSTIATSLLQCVPWSLSLRSC